MTVPDLPDASAASGNGEAGAFLERLAAGEAAAFEDLFARYFSRLRRFAYGYTRGWTEAEDLVHDVFLSLWRRRRWLGSVRDLDAYVYRITRNLAINYVRRKAVEERWYTQEVVSQHAVVADEVAHPSSAEQQLMSNERMAAILRAFDTLPPRQREVLLLRWREGKSQQEIADLLGISKNTIEIHVTRAYKQLRQLLADFLP